MLFTGHSEHTIDAKLRLAIPAKYRNQWDEKRDGKAWYCIPWPTAHLRIYTEARFRELAMAEQSTLTPTEEEADLESNLFGFAERLEMDGSGRITLPRSHLELTGLGTEVVVVGARVRLEVHDRNRWVQSTQDRFRKLPQLVSRIQADRRRDGR